ncbi:endonuclease/exonuclease/phosphatase family protein [Kitasatospora sp. NA04385]|uniref:endonuclease/exonuclease/phosphatase family protein n=1 Tax=Kitasatospora sp. NA04385 TaxID=2742135 RepID=UPI00159003C8|nr:endonuclease/exonuclease/phosphatase family protein [Kitasatospora sp. NA04385]QKW20552.1 endonuclease/exonuclease/phosphatase family protein [Kitasatospora sp. NA04385]
MTGYPPLRVVTFNSLFGGYSDDGLGLPERWDGQMEFLRSLRPDVLLVQECNFWDLLGGRRLHRAVNAIGMAAGHLARANKTTGGHRFHSVIMISDRVRVLAQDYDRARYHHTMGWANLAVPGHPGITLEVRNLHLDPFDPRNRSREVGPLEVLAAPGRHAMVAGDLNAIGADFPEPDWGQMSPHLLNGHLRPPGEAEVGDRGAVALLARAGFVDAAVMAGQADVPTAAFGDGDVPRRQDLILASPALAPAVAGYQVHRRPVDEGLSDHCAVSIDLNLG